MTDYRTYLLTWATLFAATPAIAQDLPPKTDEIVTADLRETDPDDIVVTGTGTVQSRDEVGQAITVLDADMIRRRQEINVADLLATTPGVRFNRTGTTGSVTGVSLRGAETTQTLVLIDGVKVNDPSGIGDGFDFGNLLVGNIQRIEVLRGSNSVAYGSQAIGGVVSVTTAVPTDEVAASASADYGYGDTIDAKASVSGGTGMFSGGAGVAYFDTDGISSASKAFGATEKDGYRNVTANAKLNVALDDALSMDLRGYYIDAKLDYDSFFGAPIDTPDTSRSKQYVGYAGINAALFDGVLKNRFAATYFKHDRDYFGPFGDFGYDGDNVRFEYQGVVQPVAQVKLIVGYEHERPHYDFFGDFSGFKSTADEKANIDSVYGLAVLQPVAGLSVTGGVRHDDHSQFGEATTLGANANYTPNAGQTNLRLSYGEGFKAPSLYQLYDTFSGNPDLRPERSKSYDIGIDQAVLSGRATASVTLFRRDTRSQIDFDLTSFTYGNLDRTRAKGAEVTLALRPVEALTFTAAYSYIDARDRSAGPAFGNRLPRRANNSVSTSLDYDWAFGLSTGATLTYVGDSFDDAANARRLDGYVLAGLRASIAVGRSLELYGRVDNLFDEQYSTAYGYGTYGRAAYGGVRVKLK